MPVTIRADVARNALYLRRDGFFGDAEINAAVARTTAEAKKLKAGFSVINDITGFKPADPRAGEAIAGVQADLVRLGMKHVIRIVGQNALEGLSSSTNMAKKPGMEEGSGWRLPQASQRPKNSPDKTDNETSPSAETSTSSSLGRPASFHKRREGRPLTGR